MARARRTQAERTATTRAALLEATVGSLVERGYQGTTTTEVARRAGVSPGALMHHFPTKADLLGAAVRHLFEERRAEFRKAMAGLPPGVERGRGAVEVLWSMFAGATFTAWLELWVAARVDADLRAAMVALDSDFLASSEEIFREIFVEETAASPDLPRVAVNFVFAFLSGLALANALPGYEPLPPTELVDAFTTLTAGALTADPGRTEGAP